MTLDELEWTLAAPGWDVDRWKKTLPDGRRVEVLKWSIHSKHYEGPDDFDVLVYGGDHRMLDGWENVSALVAQCVLNELLKEVPDGN